MSGEPADPRCPECGGKIGATATYCMHCSADLTEEQAAADVDGDEAWEPSVQSPESVQPDDPTAPDRDETAGLLDPDSLLDNTLTVVVGIAGGFLVGVFGTTILLLLTGSGWAVVVGFVAWLGATAYFVRRRTFQRAIATSAYAVAIVLLSVPLIALSPAVDVEGGLAGRGGLLFVLLVFVAVPAAIAAAIGWAASRVGSGGGGGGEG